MNHNAGFTSLFYQWDDALSRPDGRKIEGSTKTTITSMVQRQRKQIFINING